MANLEIIKREVSNLKENLEDIDSIKTNRLNGVVEKLLTQRGLEKGEPIERKLEDLIENGCECGNKWISNFTLVYCEDDFQYVQCEKCKRRHYVR